MSTVAALPSLPLRQRIALGVEYDGTDFSGWQHQGQAVRTVQTVLEAALTRVANHPVRVHCAGRTDAGVHALEQVVHFETAARRSERAWVLGGNVNLPPDVAIRWAHPVSDDFHARFAAEARHYRYHIMVRRTRSPLRRARAVWAHEVLDVASMRTAALALVGEHDFSSFRAAGCQAKSPVKRVHYLEVRQEAGEIILAIGANGFLHHMVRNIAGVLIAIGRGEASPGWTGELLQVRDRTRAGMTAPAHGLYFVRADYPARFALPQCELGDPLRRLGD